ncbi:CPBP family intramembrane glutamic endopeptidase [Nocardia pseudobrasiliensis]|uniref:CPBP family intramembrane glutamic endopeptidase n=1 Tax=Nocardia pseudobrasiliensis TaxID=45979 RepID=UPI001FE5F0D8|nr:CPBP family intramembrane glutamic endopeptidase [Nocardia pseudobrasiliensis]
MSLPLLWSNRVLPRLHLDIRGRTAANAVFATLYALTFGRGVPIGNPARRPLTALGPAALVAAGYGVALAIPALRTRLAGFATRAPEVPVLEWAFVHIPIGTVYSEELIFRATLDPLLGEATGPLGPWLGATTFGLWHIAPARGAGDSVPVSIAATALGGLFLGWQFRRTGGVLAPALLHYVLNAGGAVAPHLAVAVGARR